MHSRSIYTVIGAVVASSLLARFVLTRTVPQQFVKDSSGLTLTGFRLGERPDEQSWWWARGRRVGGARGPHGGQVWESRLISEPGYWKAEISHGHFAWIKLSSNFATAFNGDSVVELDGKEIVRFWDGKQEVSRALYDLRDRVPGELKKYDEPSISIAGLQESPSVWLYTYAGGSLRISFNGFSDSKMTVSDVELREK